LGRGLFQSERNAQLFIDVLRRNVSEHRFKVHDFVVMPDHVHLLLEVNGDMTVEKAMQLIKGGFSYRVKKECGYLGEVWQRGFSEERANDERSILRFREYIAQNPLKAGLVTGAETYPFSFAHLAQQKRIRAKEPANERVTPDGVDPTATRRG
jgi:putative transposase